MRLTRVRGGLGALGLLVAAWLVFYFGCPGVSGPMFLKLNRSLNGLHERAIQVGDHQIHYLEGGPSSGETPAGPVQDVLLLHGIFAEKDHWDDFAHALTASGRFHLIIPDIPGFGESTRLASGDYGYPAQIARLREFLQALHVQRFHVAGNSMGGAMACLLALQLGDQVRSVALIGAPHGIRNPVKSAFEQARENGQIPLIVHNNEEFETLMDQLFVHRPWMPWPIIALTRQHAIDAAAGNERIFLQANTEPFLIQDRLAALAQLKTPKLVIWGGGEKIFDASGAQVLREAWPTAQVVVMVNAGHLLQMEKPRESSELYLSFLQKQAN